MLDKILRGISITDLPNDDLRWIAEDCGIETCVALLLNFPGISLYIAGVQSEKVENITPENLPNEDMQLVAEKCGLEIARQLLKKFGQTIIYVPRISTTAWARSYIRSHYSGQNAKRLASTFGVSERYIYKCIKGQD
jgi:hypothetical protein